MDGLETTYRNGPSVRTLRSCKTNQMPMRSSVSASRKALAAKLPMRFRVNMPWGCPPTTAILVREVESGRYPLNDVTLACAPASERKGWDWCCGKYCCGGPYEPPGGYVEEAMISNGIVISLGYFMEDIKQFYYYLAYN